MKRKTMALILALSMCLSLLSACGGDSAQNTGEPPASNSTPSTTEQQPAESNKPEESEKPTEGEPDESAEPTQQEPENSAGTEPAVPAEMTYTFDTATGTLTCSGGGEVTQQGWLEVAKNALFETDNSKCKQTVKKVVIEDGVTAIGKEVFWKAAVTEVVIPDSVMRIGSSAFTDTPITSVTIPDSVTEMGQNVFARCQNLSSVTLPKNLSAIPENMFQECTSLTNIQIPESVTTIGSYAFGKCGLTSITIPDEVTYIGDRAFWTCPLTQITIPASVTEWKCGALEDCDSLTDVTFLGDTDMNHIQDWVWRLLSMPITIHAPAGSVIEGYVNRQIAENGAKCTFEPIN